MVSGPQQVCRLGGVAEDPWIEGGAGGLEQMALGLLPLGFRVEAAVGGLGPPTCLLCRLGRSSISGDLASLALAVKW